MEPLVSALEQIGARVSSHEGFLPAEVSGRHLAGGRLRLRPQVSSQFVTALLLVAPLMRDGLDLELVGPVPSQPYLDLTEDVLAEFGARVQRAESGRRWRVEPSSLAPTHFSVEGDWSAAAFFLAAAAVAGGTVDVGPLGRESRQGDRRVAEILARAGVEIDASDDRVRATGPATVPLRADLRHAPDLFPALAAVASVVPEGSILTGLDHLRHKESDRLSVMVENLRGLGVGLEVERSSFKVTRPVGRGAGSGARVAAAGDHRIAMAMAVTALAAGALELDDAACVSKSFPGFWECWEELVS
jgi:3-phosphoshikimate 1-carboxyvinyltransferase